MTKRSALTRFALLLALAALPAAAQLGPAPSWVLTQGAAATCADDDVFVPGVYINVPAPMFASERGVFSAPGFPDLGYTQDTSFQGVGMFGFTVFTDPFTLPAGTPLTLRVTTYREPNYLGGTAYYSYITWDCTTGAVLDVGGGVTPNSYEIPTLSSIGLVLLVLAFATIALFRLRKRGLGAR